MNAWSNIECAPDDPEIRKIDQMEKDLGELTAEVNKIRELITRFEVCHFKYQQHLQNIKDSIINLEPKVDTLKIGINHIQHGENAWKNDVTGKSLLGQQYVWAIKRWLNDYAPETITENANEKPTTKIRNWLGSKSPDKVRLVQLLVARLTWNWKLYEELQHGGKYKDLELQVCRMDICHYAFPKNLDILLQALGQMISIDEKKFEGCGSFNDSIKIYIKKELLILDNMFTSLTKAAKSDKDQLIRIWLIACLQKTLKEQVNLSKPIINIKN